MKTHQCLVYSLAMLLEEDVNVLLQELGHSGMDKVWDAPIPYCYSGHHMQEIIDLCWQRGISLTPIEAKPKNGCAIFPGEWKPVFNEPLKRIYSYLEGERAILLSNIHAVAWDGNIVWDPNGCNYPLSKFSLREAWILRHHIK